jgi:hypothetical protein
MMSLRDHLMRRFGGWDAGVEDEGPDSGLWGGFPVGLLYPVARSLLLT